MRTSRRLSLVVGLVLTASSIFAITSGSVSNAANANCDAVDGDYLIVFNRNANTRAEINGAPGKSITPQFIYDSVVNGFAAKLSAEQVCAFRKRPNIESIELDQTFQNQVVTEQSVNAATWSLDRIDVVNRSYDSKYRYSSNGASITAYVVDTGIYSKSIDFQGRLGRGFSAIRGSNSTEDCNGHGTHVAGSIGGTTYGVAKAVTLVPVRVLSCSGSGSTSGIVAGLDWILKNQPNPARAVVNMSLGGGISTSLDSAVAKLTTAGFTVVVAAGNSAANACNYSPARVPSAITVAASDINDQFASFSNFGSCVDIIAPGVNILSDGITGATSTSTKSGTSMASPHVAGAIARYLSSGYSVLDITGQPTGSIVSGVPTNTKNLLLYADPSK